MPLSKGNPRAAERHSSAAAAALSDNEFRETNIAAAVCWSVWFAVDLHRSWVIVRHAHF
jgi:hypothetical protein